MKKLKLLSILFFIPFLSYAQKDTLYVYVDNGRGWEIGIPMGKHKKDSERRDYYPFDGGRNYSFVKKAGKYKDHSWFYYQSYTPSWMSRQFSYQVVDSCIFSRKDFKNTAWFNLTGYDDIFKTFYGEDKVIFLIDERQIKDSSKIYMVQVYFIFDEEE